MDPNLKVIVGNNRYLSFVCYSIRRIADGTIHKKTPVNIYWRHFHKNDTTTVSSLSFLEKNCTYGLKIKELDSWWRLKLPCYSGRTMYMNRKTASIVWNCEASPLPPEELPELHYAFVEERTSFFQLSPDSVTVCGTAVERINP